METNTTESNTCSVCLELIGNTNVFITKCNHKFCGTCILKNFHNSNLCPLCRSELIEKEPTNMLESIEDILTSAAQQSASETTINGVPGIETTTINGVSYTEIPTNGLHDFISSFFDSIPQLQHGNMVNTSQEPETEPSIELDISPELPIATRTRSRRHPNVTEINETVNNSVNTNTMFSDINNNPEMRTMFSDTIMTESLNLLNNINNNPEMRNEYNTLVSGIRNSLIGGDMNNLSELMGNAINSNIFSNITS